MNPRTVAPVSAVLIGGSAGAQVLAGMSDNGPWQVSLLIVTATLAAYGTWIGVGASDQKKDPELSYRASGISKSGSKKIFRICATAIRTPSSRGLALRSYQNILLPYDT